MAVQLNHTIVSARDKAASAADTPEVKRPDPVELSRVMTRIADQSHRLVSDFSLAVGGLLSRKLGGPSVFPPFPESLAQVDFRSDLRWQTSAGEDRYRRGMYTHWQRSFPHPAMVALDAPSREECTVERPRSNTPQQALVLLNDPTYVEAARVLAQRVLNSFATPFRLDAGEVVTTTSITAVKASSRSDQSTTRSPDAIQVATGTTVEPAPPTT